MIYPYTARVYYLAGGYCIMVEQTDVAMRLTLHLPFDAALTRVKEALKTQGFGVMSEIDVQEAMRQKARGGFSSLHHSGRVQSTPGASRFPRQPGGRPVAPLQRHHL